MKKQDKDIQITMRYLLTMCILSITFNAFGQDLKTLERDIQRTVVTNLKEVRKKADRIYRLDPYNETATHYLVSSYEYTKHLDSIPILFDRLKSINVNNPIPYLLSAKYQFQAFSLSDTSRLAELKTAIKLDSNNVDAHYFLGTSYYSLFNQKQTNYYAFQSREQFVKVGQLEKSSLSSLKYPIIQTSSFLQDIDFINIFENEVIEPTVDSFNIPTNNTWYYPLTSFLGFKDNWASDYSVDIIHQVSRAISVLEWYSGQLFALKEPLVYNQTNKIIYRFTWLRSFHDPVAIRLEKTDNSYTLYWKQTSRRGHYAPTELIVNSSKQLTKEQWDKFIFLLKATDFWNMPTESKDDGGKDGSQWIIEGMENGKYHVVDRWTPRKSGFQKCGQYLIELTDLKVNDSDLY